MSVLLFKGRQWGAGRLRARNSCGHIAATLCIDPCFSAGNYGEAETSTDHAGLSDRFSLRSCPGAARIVPFRASHLLRTQLPAAASSRTGTRPLRAFSRAAPPARTE